MSAELGGFIGLAALIVALFAWLRADMNRLAAGMNTRMDRIESGMAELRERMARLEGTVDGLRAAVIGERARKDVA